MRRRVILTWSCPHCALTITHVGGVTTAVTDHYTDHQEDE